MPLTKALNSDTLVLTTELPLTSQQVLLHSVQEILEEMCIRVGLVVCPTVMRKQGWTQSRSLELH